jgi:hypothetical protein
MNTSRLKHFPMGEFSLRVTYDDVTVEATGRTQKEVEEMVGNGINEIKYIKEARRD